MHKVGQFFLKKLQFPGWGFSSLFSRWMNDYLNPDWMPDLCLL